MQHSKLWRVLFSLGSAALVVSSSACGGSAQATLSATAASSADDLRANTQGMLTPRSNRKVCLDVVDSANVVGAAVQIWACHASANQTWTVRDSQVVVFGDKCLSVSGTGNGAQVVLAACDPNDALQKWRIANVKLMHPASGRCLDVHNGGPRNGTRVQIYDCARGNSNQAWYMPNESSVADDGGDAPAGTDPQADPDVEAPVAAVPVATTGSALVNAAVTQQVNFSDWGIGGGFTAIPLDRLMALHPVIARYENDYIAAAAQANPVVPPQLLVALVLQESSGGQNVGSYGGPFQFTDDRAWNAYGPPGGDRNNMAQAAKGAANYMSLLIKQSNGDLNAALRGYNGPVANGGLPSYQADIQRWMSGEMVYGSGV
jgi:hypothetical protein